MIELGIVSKTMVKTTLYKVIVVNWQRGMWCHRVNLDEETQLKLTSLAQSFAREKSMCQSRYLRWYRRTSLKTTELLEIGDKFYRSAPNSFRISMYLHRSSCRRGNIAQETRDLDDTLFHECHIRSHGKPPFPRPWT
jgi:hypothetical protein